MAVMNLLHRPCCLQGWLPYCTLSRDPADDNLLALAEHSQALLVSGDKDLLALAGERRILSPAEFQEFLQNMGLT